MGPRTAALLTALLIPPTLTFGQSVAFPVGERTGAETYVWRADHHMHLASPDLCSRVGECLSSNRPEAVLAADAVRVLDQAHVAKGVVCHVHTCTGCPHCISRRTSSRGRRAARMSSPQQKWPDIPPVWSDFYR